MGHLCHRTVEEVAMEEGIGHHKEAEAEGTGVKTMPLLVQHHDAGCAAPCKEGRTEGERERRERVLTGEREREGRERVLTGERVRERERGREGDSNQTSRKLALNNNILRENQDSLVL